MTECRRFLRWWSKFSGKSANQPALRKAFMFAYSHKRMNTSCCWTCVPFSLNVLRTIVRCTAYLVLCESLPQSLRLGLGHVGLACSLNPRRCS